MNNMTTVELIYHCTVLPIAVLTFFIVFTASNVILEILIKTIGKIVPLFLILYAGLQIFKYFGII